jgi:hypothetical protein
MTLPAGEGRERAALRRCGGEFLRLATVRSVVAGR